MKRRRIVLTLDGELSSVRDVLRALLHGSPCMVGAFMLVGPNEEVVRAAKRAADPRCVALDDALHVTNCSCPPSPRDWN